MPPFPAPPPTLSAGRRGLSRTSYPVNGPNRGISWPNYGISGIVLPDAGRRRSALGSPSSLLKLKPPIQEPKIRPAELGR